MYTDFQKPSTARPGVYRCPSCGTHYNPTYGSCPTCNPHRPHAWPLALLALLLALVALPLRAQTGRDQALTGRVFIDLNTNSQHDYGEPYQPNILVEARHINSEIRNVWTDTSTATGDYHLLLWDPGAYDIKAYCEQRTGNLSSIRACWRTPTNAPVEINGSGQSLDIPLPPQRLYLPIAIKR